MKTGPTARHQHTFTETRVLLSVVPWKQAVFIWGPPGVGKTDLVFQLAGEDGAEVLVLKASELRPEDLSGLPDLSPEGFTEFRPPRALYDLTENASVRERAAFDARKAAGEVPPGAEWEEPRPVYLFLDEFSNAQPDMVAPFQYLTLNRTVGGMSGLRLRPTVRIIAAGNREEDGAYANALSTPLKSRFFHIHLQPTLEEWKSWARLNEIHSSIVAFLSARESLFHDFDPRRADQTFPCPRTWAQLSAVLHGLDRSPEAGNRHLRRLAAESCVGPGAAVEFSRFEKTTIHAPTAEDIIRAPGEIDPYADQPDTAMVCIENLLAACIRDPDRFVDGSLEYVARMHLEYQTLFHSSLMNLHGNVPEAVIRRALASPRFETIRASVSHLNRVRRDDRAARGAGNG